MFVWAVTGAPELRPEIIEGAENIRVSHPPHPVYFDASFCYSSLSSARAITLSMGIQA
jgi:hypothetical protein